MMIAVDPFAALDVDPDIREAIERYVGKLAAARGIDTLGGEPALVGLVYGLTLLVEGEAKRTVARLTRRNEREEWWDPAPNPIYAREPAEDEQ